MNFNKHSLKAHEKVLKGDFFTKTKWPHFDLLFEDIQYFSKNSKK